MDWWERPPPEQQDAPAGAHLFVCQHGLWGSPEDVAFLEQYLQHNGWLTLNARSNSARCTFDGADVCGDRLAAEVVAHVQRLAAGGVTVTHISFAAYSFGGLIARYAVGKLLAGGFFSVVAPVNFLTIASPHLGCWEHPSSMSHLAYNSLLPWTLSRTGRQLLLADRWLEPEGLPLLAAMARPDLAFHAGLAAFRKRVLLADIRSDRTVPYTTAAITAVNPYLPGGAAAAAPYTLSADGATGAVPSGCGCAPGCGCGCVSRRGFEPLAEAEEGEEDDEEDGGAGAPAAFCDSLGGLVDGDGGGVGAGAGGLLRTWGHTLGLGSVLGFGLGVASLLFGGGSAGEGKGGRRAWRSAAGGRCGCSGGCGGAAAAAAATGGAAAPAVIPLPISSSYPCIVAPHPAPLPAPAVPAALFSAAAAAGRRACPVPCGPGNRRPPPAAAAAAAPCALHRSASSPLPKLRHAGACAADASGGDDGGGGGTSSSTEGTCSGTISSVVRGGGGRRKTAETHGGISRHGSDATFSYSTGSGCSISGAGGAAGYPYRPAPSHDQSSARYGSALYRLHEIRHGRWYGQAHVPGSTAVPAPVAAPRGGHAGSGGRGGSEDDALASRVRLGLFVALLPVLLSLWLCMVAWLAAIWIHHYAVLLTVRPDRSWDVRMRGTAAAAAGAAAMEASEAAGDCDSSSGGDGARSSAAPEAVNALAGSGVRGGDVMDDDRDGLRDGDGVDGDDGGGSGMYDSGEMELCMSLTEAPPPSPPAPLLLQRQRRGSLGCRGDDAAAGDGAPRAYPSDCSAARGPYACAAATAATSATAEATRGGSGEASTQGSGSCTLGRSSSPFERAATAGNTTAAEAAGTAEVLAGAPPQASDGEAAADIDALTEPSGAEPSGLREGAQGRHEQTQRVYSATAERTAAAVVVVELLPPPPHPPRADVVEEPGAAVKATDGQIGDPVTEEPKDLVSQAFAGSVGGPAAGAKAAAPASTAAEVHADIEVGAVRSIVRALFRSVVRKYDGRGGPEPAVGLAAAPEAVALGAGAGAEGKQEVDVEVAADRHFVRALTRSIFQSLAARHVASSGQAPVVAAATAAGGDGDGASSSDVLPADGDGSRSTDSTAAATAPRPPIPRALQHQQQQQPTQVLRERSENGCVGEPARAARPGQEVTGESQLRRRGEAPPPPPAPVPAQEVPQVPPPRAAESGPARPQDPAALLSEMIANLNQLEWQKVDVDTRHYHAHAAIVVRSSRRFRSHMHIIDYAVRQLRL
ncbi:hypothetical protein PLESTB_001261800 [Pleodorina starrii]|uniref:DUF676 domain-containing protein n=1 Tax=Pleodorina starrii TaxID=330485 RepID=A0A9W6BTM8_9CHLO|nr:hypothetical protein PLESTM_001074700 [Pleodorina starrii]GLC57760.1 hypothetical protein PLESTB_001261800 [Pleodorina starrii]GLC75939.1 hypothetical protein PLESTF_001708200 [Pleodorina starrii]